MVFEFTDADVCTKVPQTDPEMPSEELLTSITNEELE